MIICVHACTHNQHPGQSRECLQHPELPSLFIRLSKHYLVSLPMISFLFDFLIQFQTAIVRNELCKRPAARWPPWSAGVYLCLFDFDSNHLLPLLDDLYQLVTFFHKFCLMHSRIHLPREAKVLERDCCFGLLLHLKGSDWWINMHNFFQTSFSKIHS